MLKFFRYLFAALLICFACETARSQVREVDVCIYGATSGGVIAAYTARQAGKTVLLVEPSTHLGGLSSGGLGYTDIGNKYVITGLARDFYRRLGKHYGRLESWTFEPGVAKNIFQQYLDKAAVDVLYNHNLVAVKKKDGYLQEITLEHLQRTAGNKQLVVKARMFIDCSYEGDLMAKAGVSYTVGRESNSQYNETYNGVQLLDKHQFPDGVDPYKIPGDKTSGLLWGISPEPLAPQGSGDKKVQTYNFRICLTNKPENRIDIARPADYDSTKYELLLRYLAIKKPVNLNDRVLKIDYMPNGKTDINNNGPFSTDMIGVNYDYPESDYATRKKLQDVHESYIKGLLYFLGHDLRVPQHLRTEMLQWGYPKDEYPGNNHWSPQMYVREARRMVGAYVMTQHNCEGREVVKDGVGMAAYTMDSHNCQRVVVNGMVKNEGDVQIGGFGPYPVAYRSLTPVEEECKNLLVPVCLSATHIAYGSIRMEPVFMVLSQSAAMAAVMAINANTSVQKIDVNRLRQVLLANPLADGSTAEILVDNDDAAHVTIKGNWSKSRRGSYGPSLLIDSTAGAVAGFVRFSPAVKKAGNYKAYLYFPKLAGTATATRLVVFNGRQRKEITINEADIRVEGQTSGEWVPLGTIRLQRGSNAYIEVSNQGANGPVLADALLLVPERQ